MKLTHNIPIEELRVGDHFKALLPCLGQNFFQDKVLRTCTLVEIHGPILRVKTESRKHLTPIYRIQIRGLAWGNR